MPTSQNSAFNSIDDIVRAGEPRPYGLPDNGDVNDAIKGDRIELT